MGTSSWHGSVRTRAGLCLLMAICGAANAATAPSVSSGLAITSVTVTPNPATAIIGTQVQFAAQVSGTGSYNSGVTWSLLAPAGSSLSPGTLSSTGLYITPYPAPATVTVTATSTQDPSQSGSVTVALAPPPAAVGPPLTVDAGQRTHPINPYIYGMNDSSLALTPSIERAANLPVERWGGDQTTRYNYLVDAYNNAADWYFENSPGSNGALAQADLLGIFGSYGLDMATIWWNTYDAETAVAEQLPTLMAFEVYRNYDGKNSMFGDVALASTSANQGMLSVYGALRSLDNAVTVVVINKTYGDLTSTVSFANLRPKSPAKVFLYSNANLAAIVAQPDLAVTPPVPGSTTSTLTETFPAQSITVLAVPTAQSERKRAPLLRLAELYR